MPSVDGADSDEETAEIFAEKVESLYPSISTNSTEMDSIKDEIKISLMRIQLMNIMRVSEI